MSQSMNSAKPSNWFRNGTRNRVKLKSVENGRPSKASIMSLDGGFPQQVEST